MNFDELHDPDPPRPDAATLANVASRARTLRRRRTALVTGGAAIAMVAVVVPTALVVMGGEDTGRLVPATVPATAPPTTAPMIAPVTTAPVDTSAPPISSPTTPTFERPITAAILGNGDAVLVAPDDTQGLLYDGADPNDSPAEGELSLVASIAVMADGRSYVSTCCELVPGTFFEVGVSQPSPRFGHGLEVSPDGTRLASVGYFELAVRDVEGQPIASIANEAGGADPYAVMWVDDARLAVLHRPADVDETRLSVVSPDTLDTFDDGGTVIPFGGSSSQGAEIQPSMSFAGMSASGAILVLDDDVSDSLLAYDPSTLARRSGDDVASGEYRWARRYD